MRDLTGLTVSANGPALPACFGDIAPSAQPTKRLYFTVKAAGRFALNLTHRKRLWLPLWRFRSPDMDLDDFGERNRGAWKKATDTTNSY